MTRVRSLFEASGLTLHDLGLKMGYPEETARKSAWQFIQKTDDPRVSMLRRFAKAVGVSIEELVTEKGKGRSPGKGKGVSMNGRTRVFRRPDTGETKEFTADSYENDTTTQHSQERFDSVQETAEVLQDPVVMKAIKAHKQGRGGTVSLEEAKQKLGL